MRKNFWIGTLATALLLSLAWGYNQFRQADDFRMVIENQNRRAFQDLASHLDQLETDLAKSRVAAAPGQRVLYLSQVWAQSEAATKDFAQLPAEQVGLSNVSKFLTQAGDFTRTLASKIVSGGKVEPHEEKLLGDMHERLLTVNRTVGNLWVRLDTESLGWINNPPTLRQRLGLGRPIIAEAAAEGLEGAAQSVRSGLDQLDASLQKLPPFSYTGEYSTRSVSQPLGLPAGEVSREQAQAIARDFLVKIGIEGAAPEFIGETKSPLGGYQWKQSDIVLEVSRRGGVVTIYRDQRTIQQRALSTEDAKEKIMATLKKLGWNLVLTSTEDFGSYLQFEAVSEKNGVRIYPDKVRVMIAMDNGQLIGLDSTPYWAFHHDRKLEQNRILTLDEAQKKLRSNFQITENRLAVIPKTGNKELLCYEFRGRYMDEDYLIYINALTGAEEKIQRIIHTPRGEYLQ